MRNMMSRRCPNCGLENIPERATCKRCGTELRAYSEQKLDVSIETLSTVDSNTAFDLNWLLARRQFLIHSPLTSSEVQARLQTAFREEIVRANGTGWFQRRYTYRGSLIGAKLVLYGPYGYRVSALKTEGTIEASGEGCILQLQSTPTAGSLAGFVIPIGLWVVFVLVMTWGSLIMLFPLLMSMLFYTIFVAGINSGATDIATMLASMVAKDTNEHEDRE